jgi:hypothetical protein
MSFSISRVICAQVAAFFVLRSLCWSLLTTHNILLEPPQKNPMMFKSSKSSSPAVVERVADERTDFYQRAGRLSLEIDRVHVNLLQL